MELRVCVDGIQKVVCGVTYSTTCQDIVLALACALGQTGRFSLVEAWRETERPLTPDECPLQSLHKLGEYAGEVKYYLIQAGMDKADQLQMDNQKENVSASNMQRFRHNFTLPDKSRRCLHSAQLIKRSSTFSGAHQSLYGTMSSSLSQSSVAHQSLYGTMSSLLSQSSATHKSLYGTCSSLSQSSVAHQSLYGTMSSSLSQSSAAHQSLYGTSSSLSQSSAAHQSLYGTISSSLSQSSATLSQQRGTHALVTPALPPVVAQELDPGIYVTSNEKPGCLPLNPISSSPLRSPHRSVKTAPESFTSREASLQPNITPPFTFSEDAGKHHKASYCSQDRDDFSALTHKYNPPKQLKMTHANPRNTHQPMTESSQLSQPSSPQLDHPTPMLRKQQQQFKLAPQLPYSEITQSDQQSHPVPSPRHHLAPSSPVLVQETVPTHVRLKGSQKPRQQKENFNDEQLRTSACVPHRDVNSAMNSCIDKGESTNMNVSETKVSSNHPSQCGQGSTSLNHKPSSILRITREYLQKNRNLQKLEHSSENNQGRAKLKDTSESSSDITADVIKYATLDRHFMRSKPHPALPSRSLSIGHGDEDHKFDKSQLIRSQLGSNGDCFQHRTEDKMSPVMKQENSTNSSIGNYKKMSSFASAVAHLRQHNGSVDQNKAYIAHIRQHSEDASMKPASHVRQHSSDSSNADNYVKAVLTSSGGHVQTISAQWLIGISNNNIKYNNTSLQQSSIKPSLSFNNTSSLRHNSAPKNVSRQSSHQESHLPQSHTPALSNKYSEVIQLERVGNNCSTSSSNQNQGSSHSEPARLECKDSNCDQNLPDMLTKDAAECKRAKGNISVEVGVTSNQADREYQQLLRTVGMQQERIELQEDHISSADLEITSLEEKEVRNEEQLQAILDEISRFEVQEATFNEELDSLDKTEWITALEKEHEAKANINLQITSLRAKVEQLESQIKQLKDEEDKKSKEINSEEERKVHERKQNEELERKVTSEKEELEEQLDKLNTILSEKDQQLKSIDKEIHEADAVLSEKEEQVKSIEEELKNQDNMTYSQTKVHSIFPVMPNNTAFPVSDSGEAILKILEGQLSAQSPPTSPFIDEVDNLGGITSAQHLYPVGSTVRTAGGVWV